MKKMIVIILAVLMIALLVFVIDTRGVVNALLDADIDLLIYGLLILLGGLLLISIRWCLLMGRTIGFVSAFHSNSISYMIRMFMPIPLPAIRVTTISLATPLSIGEVTPAAIVELLFGLVERLVFLLLFLAAMQSDSRGGIFIWAALLIALFVGILWLSHHIDDYLPNIRRGLSKFHRVNEESLEFVLVYFRNGLKSLGSTWRLTLVMLITLVIAGSFQVGYILILGALGVDIGSDVIAALAMILFFIPPLRPSMIVLSQIVMVPILLAFQVGDTASVLAFSVLVYGIEMIAWVIAGMWALIHSNHTLHDIIYLPRKILAASRNLDDLINYSSGTSSDE